MLNLGNTFVSELIDGLKTLPEIQTERASLKQQQTVTVSWSSHGTLKRILKLNTYQQWTGMINQVQIASFIHIRSHYSAYGCSSRFLFQGNEPLKLFELRRTNTLIQRFFLNAENVSAIQQAMNNKLGVTNFKLTGMQDGYRANYHCKAKFKSLAFFARCLLLNG